jgi:hypothetical protein
MQHFFFSKGCNKIKEEDTTVGLWTNNVWLLRLGHCVPNEELMSRLISKEEHFAVAGLQIPNSPPTRQSGC